MKTIITCTESKDCIKTWKTHLLHSIVSISSKQVFDFWESTWLNQIDFNQGWIPYFPYFITSLLYQSTAITKGVSAVTEPISSRDIGIGMYRSRFPERERERKRNSTFRCRCRCRLCCFVASFSSSSSFLSCFFTYSRCVRTTL